MQKIVITTGIGLVVVLSWIVYYQVGLFETMGLDFLLAAPLLVTAVLIVILVVTYKYFPRIWKVFIRTFSDH